MHGSKISNAIPDPLPKYNKNNVSIEAVGHSTEDIFKQTINWINLLLELINMYVAALMARMARYGKNDIRCKWVLPATQGVFTTAGKAKMLRIVWVHLWAH